MLYQFGSPSCKSLLAKLSPDEYYIVRNGKLCPAPMINDFIEIFIRGRGGKGGFGAMLKSFKVFKCPNQNMCRDLTGRRIKDVEEEKKIKEWMNKRAAREAEKERLRQERLDKLRHGVIKHTFNDPTYTEQSEAIIESTEDAMAAAVKAQSDNLTHQSKSLSPNAESSSDESVDLDIAGTSVYFRTKRKRKVTVDDELPKAKYPKLEPKFVDDAPISHGLKHSKSMWKEDRERYTSGEEDDADDDHKAPKVIKASDHQTPPPENKEEKKNKKNQTKKGSNCQYEQVDLMALSSVEELNKLPIEHLKQECMRRGLKCGGSAEERADRLWQVRSLKQKKWPKHLLAKPGKT